MKRKSVGLGFGDFKAYETRPKNWEQMTKRRRNAWCIKRRDTYWYRRYGFFNASHVKAGQVIRPIGLFPADTFATIVTKKQRLRGKKILIVGKAVTDKRHVRKMIVDGDTPFVEHEVEA